MLSTPPVRPSVFAAGFAAALTFFIPARPAITVGRSMEPTLRSGQPFLFSTQPASELKRGDVVVLKMGGIPSVKRIVALGGEVLWVVPQTKGLKDVVWAVAPGEDLAVWRKKYAWMGIYRYVVPAGTVYVVGDSPFSQDSRHYGPIREAAIMGRVVWPALTVDVERANFYHRLVSPPHRGKGHPIRIARR